MYTIRYGYFDFRDYQYCLVTVVKGKDTQDYIEYK